MTTSCLTVFPVPAATPVSSHLPKMSPFAFITIVLHLACLFIAQRLHPEPIDDPDRDADFPFAHVAARDIVAVEVFQALRFVLGYVPADQSIGIRRERQNRKSTCHPSLSAIAAERSKNQEVEKMSAEIEDDGDVLFHKQAPTPAAGKAAAGKKVEGQICYADGAKPVLEATPLSMAEQTVQIGGGCRPTEQYFHSSLQVFHLPQDSGKEAQVQQALPEDLKMLYSTMKLGLPAEINVEFQATYQIKICSFEAIPQISNRATIEGKGTRRSTIARCSSGEAKGFQQKFMDSMTVEAKLQVQSQSHSQSCQFQAPSQMKNSVLELRMTMCKPEADSG
ncbi:unnamed protein product [Miscanthus lutarioriparius]|uniref:Uncharacterized protein n=1 Tax=Miscanthus lutarioriparius TaxID=422564 RepID=A0A811Q8P2_9POAL|nr:unnamed protein product [Miscanthus lutarioriparius]